MLAGHHMMPLMFTENNDRYFLTVSLPKNPTQSARYPLPSSYEEFQKKMYDEILCRTQFKNSKIDNYCQSPIPSIYKKSSRGRPRDRDQETKLQCSVCGDVAVPHSHHGGISCVSCR